MERKILYGLGDSGLDELMFKISEELKSRGFSTINYTISPLW